MGERLDSWKGIAAYLGREVRTVQRWAAVRSLPVHHLPGGARPRVFALKPEIDAWMRAGGGAAAADALSIAVLPFADLSGSAEGQHFGEGLADGIIDILVRVPGVRVTARTSSFASAGRGRDERRIGARLGVAWLLKGSVCRDRGRVRIFATLVNTRDGFDAWSERYDRNFTDLFAIQDEIASAIAGALKLKLALEPASPPPPADGVAYDLWIKGRSISQQLTPLTFAEARECYERAIARAPGFARPYAGLAELLFKGVRCGLAPAAAALPCARQALAKALELDDRCGEAHGLRGIALGLLDYDWDGGEAAFQRAFEVTPGSAELFAHHAWYQLVPRLRIGKALDEVRQAVTLDPLSPRAHGTRGLVLLTARRYAEAVEECQRALQLAPGLWWLRWSCGVALLMQGRIAEGLRLCRQVCDEIHRPLLVGALALVCGLFLRSDEARALLSELEAMAPTSDVPPLAFAWAYIGLGDDRLFEWLGKAIEARNTGVTHLPSMPLYDGIRDDPRFAALLVRMNLAGAAASPA